MLSEALYFNFDYVYKAFESEVIVVGNQYRLFTEGEKDEYVYFIRSGSVKILKNDWLVSVVQANEFVGIHASINDSAGYFYSGIVAEPSVILRIKKQDFKDYILRNPEFSNRVLKMLCNYNQLIDDKILAFVHSSPRNRIIKELLSISQKSKDSGNIFLKEKDLSELTGVYLEDVTLILKQLKEMKFLEEFKEKGNNGWRIINYEQLKGVLSEYKS